jgi:hypothetical protein
MTSYEKNSDVAGIENEIAIFESFRSTALELGLASAALHLTEEVLVRRQAIVRYQQAKSSKSST